MPSIYSSKEKGAIVKTYDSDHAESYGKLYYMLEYADDFWWRCIAVDAVKDMKKKHDTKIKTSKRKTEKSARKAFTLTLKEADQAVRLKLDWSEMMKMSFLSIAHVHSKVKTADHGGCMALSPEQMEELAEALMEQASRLKTRTEEK